MIIRGLLELVFGLLQIVFAPINIPPLPDNVQTVVDEFVEVIMSGIGLLSIFVDLDVLAWLIPVVIIIVNFERVWNLIMFILRKIPFVGIE